MSNPFEPSTQLSEKLLQQQRHEEAKADIEEQVIIDDTLNGGAVQSGEKQAAGFRDAWAAVLFLSHFIAIIYLAFKWGIPSLTFKTRAYGEDEEVHFSGVLILCIVSSLIAIVFSALSLTVMSRLAKQLVQACFAFGIVCHGILAILFAVEKYWVEAAVAGVVFAWATCSAWSIWKRIPFAAANLETALTAVKANGGITMAAYGMTAFVNVFSVFWMLAWLGVYVRSAQCQDGECVSHMNPVVMFLLLLSFYWTTEVGKNILHVTVSGVVGTWWFAPDDAGQFCSPAITDSFIRASTYSLGSICFGSLLTATLQVLYHMLHAARNHGRMNDILLCVLECLVSILERLVSYFNKWAYVYVGLYGYDYLTAGKKVMTLFMQRGWTSIINDNLVANVLILMSFMVGVLTGGASLLIVSAKPGWVHEFGEAATIVAFFLPFLIGTSMAYILMSVVASAVDTVIVAFAEAPLEFERNHPGLHSQMTNAWRRIYPDEFTM